MSLNRIFWRRRIRLPSQPYVRFITSDAQSASQQPGYFPPNQTEAPNPSQRTVPRLLPDETQLMDNGIPGLFTAEAFREAWYEYQGLLLERVDALTAQTEHAFKDIKDILLVTARDPLKAALFNHASMAHNNWFFFKSLNHDGKRSEMPGRLSQALDRSFDGLESLRQQFITTAQSMFAPGFVWLVRTRRDYDSLRSAPNSYDDMFSRSPRDFDQYSFAILSTYAAGSPYSGAHNRQQPVDMNTQNIFGPGGLDTPARLGQLSEQHTTIQNTVGTIGLYSRRGPNLMSFGGVEVTPVLCVNTWQQVWLLDWTIRGKRQFLDAWWERINWGEVSRVALGSQR